MFSKRAIQLLGCKGRKAEMVDDSACKVIDIRTVNVTERDGKVNVTERDETVRALKVVRYVPKAQYNLISIGVLDEEGYWIQLQ